jgi:hypothetical protein
MELDSILQISFGISATLIAILALWFAWHTARGKPVLSELHQRLFVNVSLGRTSMPRRTNSNILPSYYYPHAATGAPYFRTRRIMFVEDTFGHFALNGLPHLPTTQETGRIFDVADR